MIVDEIAQLVKVWASILAVDLEGLFASYISHSRMVRSSVGYDVGYGTEGQVLHLTY